MSNTCVVGLGSPCGDDRFGWVVADRLATEVRRRGLTGVVVRRALFPVQLLNWLDGLERLLLIDACQGLNVGDGLLRLDWPGDQWREVRGRGSHDYTVWQTLQLADRLGSLPARCHLWCAPGLQFHAEGSLSPALLAQVPKVVDDVLDTLTK